MDTIKLSPIEIRDSILKIAPYFATNIQKEQIDGEAIRDAGDFLRSIPNVSGGINNIFDRSYYEHLNRKILGTTGKLYEPGRVFYITVNVKI